MLAVRERTQYSVRTAHSHLFCVRPAFSTSTLMPLRAHLASARDAARTT
jgi:hypothetical protein